MSFLGNKIKKVIKCSLDKCGYCICSNKYKNQIVALEEDKQVIEEKPKRLFDMPPILLVAMPKSAGKYIRTKLVKNLCIEDSIVDNSEFPLSMLQTTFLEYFCKGNAVAHTHINMSTINGLGICKAVDRFVLHIRDPRNAIISMLHHLDYRNEHIDDNRAHIAFFSQAWPYFGEKYTSLSFDKKFDLFFEFFYMELLNWMDEWFQVLELDFSQPRSDIYTLSSRKIVENCKKYSCMETIETPVLLTTHEDLVANGERHFFEKLLVFYGIPREAWAGEDLVKDMSVHFRSGKTNTWKEELSPEQQNRLTKALPQDWCKFFGWEC